MINEKEAEKFGYDAGKNGADTINCNFRIFATKELTKAWERGKARAELNKIKRSKKKQADVGS